MEKTGFWKKLKFTILNEFKPIKFFDFEKNKYEKKTCDKRWCFLNAIQIYYEGKPPKRAKLKSRCIWHIKKFKN